MFLVASIFFSTLIPCKSVQEKQTFSLYLLFKVKVEGFPPHLYHLFCMHKPQHHDSSSAETVLANKPSRWPEGPSWVGGAAPPLKINKLKEV